MHATPSCLASELTSHARLLLQSETLLQTSDEDALRWWHLALICCVWLDLQAELLVADATTTLTVSGGPRGGIRISSLCG